MSCTATDAAGNSASASFVVTVKGAAAQLADLAEAVAHVGPGKSLAAKIALAQRLLAEGRPRRASLVLESFEHEVRAQSGKKIPARQAAGLIADAERIQAVLGWRGRGR